MRPDFEDTIPTYERLGFNEFLEKPLGGVATQAQGGGFSNLNFDQVQVGGSLGDRIQIGGSSVSLDGSGKKFIFGEIEIDGDTSQIIIKDKNKKAMLIDGKEKKIRIIDKGIDVISIDGVNKRMLVNDGANDIILSGYQQGGF